MLTRSLSKLFLQSPTGMLTITTISSASSSQQCFSLIERSPQLHNLPQEILVHILCHLSTSDVGNLCISGSLILRDKIISWIQSKSFCSWLLKEVNFSPGQDDEEETDKWIEISSQFGILAKRASMIYSTSMRLRLLSKWYERVEDMVVEHYSQDEVWPGMLRKIGLASALASFSLGWDEVEFNKILGWLRDGVEEQEISGDLRRILRLYLWQFLNNDITKGSWLYFLMRTGVKTFSHSYEQPFSHSYDLTPRGMRHYQGAELLLCLFGPVEEVEDTRLSEFKNEVLTRLCGKPTFALNTSFTGGYHEAKNIFADLGKALSVLLKSNISKKELAQTVHTMFDQFPWHIDNLAACLLFSCERLVKIYLTLVVDQEDGTRRLAQILVALVIVCGRLSNNLDQGLDKILEWSVSLPDYEQFEMFVQEFWTEFSRRVKEEDVSSDLITQLGCFITMTAVKKLKDEKMNPFLTMEVEE